MRSHWRRFCAVLLLLPMPDAFGQEPTTGQEPLTAEQVLATSAEHFPGILKSIAERRVAEGRATEALGAFDLVFSGDSLNWVEGYYDGRRAEGEVAQPLRPFGAKLYGKYSLSAGDFPIYQDEFFTNEGGDFKLGAVFSLLRNRDIDARRFAEIDAQLGLREADLELLLTRVGVQQRALVAFWRWAAAGQQVEVYEGLLDIALEREEGLKTEIERGRRAEIFLTENRQNIVRRRTLLTNSRRDFRVAANRLAFFLRDESGQPEQPTPERLPAMTPPGQVPAINFSPTLDMAAVLERRPELLLLRTAAQRALRRIDLAENELKPRLDFNVELSQPIGSIGEGGVSRDQTDTIAGIEFSVPLQRRAARGKISQARARLDALQQEQRQVTDQLEIELRNILLDLGIARQLMELAAQEVEQADIMREAEVKRFEQGASDFFLVNLREERAADARVRYYQAYREARIARANYDAATVNLARLGL